MATEVTVSMPLALTSEMIRAVRDHDTTATDDRDEWHRRLGWLICAWDVLIEHRSAPGGDGVVVPREALEWLLGERGEFEPSDAHLPQPEGYKRPQFWWRGEFRKRAGL
jgi:hypothetical protein